MYGQQGGTVSHGTLQPRDLIPAFMAVLDEHRPAVAERLRAEYQETVDDPDGAFDDFVGWLVDDLFDALNELAPDVKSSVPTRATGPISGSGRSTARTDDALPGVTPRRHDEALQTGSTQPREGTPMAQEQQEQIGTVVVPDALAREIHDWVEDRAACSAAEDDPNGDPWWEDSDDAAAELVRRVADLLTAAQRA